jgi:hypothetical protein
VGLSYGKRDLCIRQCEGRAQRGRADKKCRSPHYSTSQESSPRVAHFQYAKLQHDLTPRLYTHPLAPLFRATKVQPHVPHAHPV